MTEETKMILAEISGLKQEMENTRSALEGEISGLREEMKGEISGLREEMKSEVSGLREEMKGEISGLREEMKGTRSALEGKISGLRQDMESEVSKLKQDTQEIRRTPGNETNKNIRIIAEAHLDLSRKLDEALKVENQKEMLLIRVTSLENEVRRLKSRNGEMA